MQIKNQNSIHAAAVFGNEQENGIRVATASKNPGIKHADGKAGDAANGNVSASSLHLGENSVESRKQLARKQAMKVVSDAFDGEKAMDRNLSDIKDSITRLNADMSSRKQEMKENEEVLADLRAQYGIEEGSEEEKGLKRAAMKANCRDGMTSEEYSALSEYQQRALYYVSSNQVHEMEIERDKSLLAANVQSATDLELERLKNHDMIDAQKDADDIMAAAEKDAIAMLTQEAVDHIGEECHDVVVHKDPFIFNQ